MLKKKKKVNHACKSNTKERLANPHWPSSLTTGTGIGFNVTLPEGNRLIEQDIGFPSLPSTSACVHSQTHTQEK